MTAPAFILVTAPPGRVVPIHRLDGAGLSGVQLQVVDGEVVRVRFAGSQTVRRSIARGDLIPCDMNGTEVPTFELAAAPDELPGGRIVLARKAFP
jgi:hypothetical protein